MKAAAKSLRPHPLRRVLVIVAATLPMLAFGFQLSNRECTWLILPDVGRSPRAVRGAVDTWLRRTP